VGRVIWSPSALEDADLIAQYIARDSADRAALFVSRLFEAADRLAGFPDVGRIIPEMNDASRREVFVGPYRLMYRIEGGDVWIVTIVHGARDWPNPR
jgi:plasmid stabilization system protein ParE